MPKVSKGQTTQKNATQERVNPEEPAPIASKRAVKAVTNQAARRAAVLEAAAELFERAGYSETNVDRIAQAVGLSKPALYHYFKSKDEILFAIHDAFTSRILADWERIHELDDPLEQLRSLCVSFFKVTHDQRAQVRTFFSFFGEVSPQYRDMITERRQLLSDVVEATIRRCIKAGKCRDVDPRLIMLLITGTFNWSPNWYQPDGPLSPTQLGDIAFELFVYGLQPQQPEPKRPARRPVKGRAS